MSYSARRQVAVQALRVELEPGGPRITVARLADASRVQQPVPGADVELIALVPRLTGRALAVEAMERERDVRVPDDADPLRLDVERQLRLQRREHVLPHRVARTGVVEAHDLVRIRRGERLEKLRVSSEITLAGPLRRPPRDLREVRDRQRTGDGEVVVAGQADVGVLPHQLHAGVRIRAVSDDVPKTPDGLAIGMLGSARAPPRRPAGWRVCRRRSLPARHRLWRGSDRGSATPRYPAVRLPAGGRRRTRGGS